MAETELLSTLASLPSPVIPAPPGEVYTPDQWQTLFSLLEVFVPAISTTHNDASAKVSAAQLEAARSEIRRYLPEDASPQLVDDYLSESTLSYPAYTESVKRKVKLHVPASDARALGFILSALNTTVGSLALTGYRTPIHRQPLATRTNIVTKWSDARIPLLRTIYRSLDGLSRMNWIYTSPTLFKLLDFPTIPKNIERNDSYDFTFHDFSSPSTPTNLSTDVVIVGSGCGAGVTASHLARAGLKVLVLESAYHFPSSHFPMNPSEGGEHLFLNGGALMSDDGSVANIVGSSFGGGGTINWSASLQTPAAIRREWASGGLPHFTGPEFQDCLDTVCDRMGVAKRTDAEALAKIEHNHANHVLREGARRAGMSVDVIPQNGGTKPHPCGYCMYGCPSATKQGPVNNWFPDAAAHGAEFIEGCFVEEVTFQPGSKRVANGVKATWTSRDRQTTRKLTISAKRVIVAAGTLNSPAVLQRSGLTNPNIGANLHLHPAATVWSVYKERTNPWEGAIMTAVVTSLDDLDGHHHGPKLEVICSVPGVSLLTYPWRPSDSLAGSPSASDAQENTALRSAIRYKVNVAKHGYSAGLIAITRDQDTGRVYIDPNDPERRLVRVAYTPSARDRARLLQGSLANIRISYSMGAIEIDPGSRDLPRFVRPSSLASSKATTKEDDDAAFEAWIKLVETKGLGTPDRSMVASAHQMGTCRMSDRPSRGVVDSRGRVFGTRGLYVADASTFPSASGVNPMISIMGIAEWVARGIVRELAQEQQQQNDGFKAAALRSKL